MTIHDEEFACALLDMAMFLGDNEMAKRILADMPRDWVPDDKIEAAKLHMSEVDCSKCRKDGECVLQIISEIDKDGEDAPIL